MQRAGSIIAIGAALLLAACNSATPPDAVLSAEKTKNPSAFKLLALGLNAQKKQISEQNEIASARAKKAIDLTALTPADESVTASITPVPLKGGITLDDKQAIGTYDTGPLAGFRQKLAALKTGKRRKPVTILHIGDSHVASDSFSRGIRKALQVRYGNAGRGMVLPASAFKYGVADGVNLKTNVGWRSETALKRKAKKRFGISGVRVWSDDPKSVMTLESKTGTFDWAEVTVATGPYQSSFIMSVGDTRKRFKAFSKKKSSKTFRMKVRGKRVTIRPFGIGSTTVLNWSTGKNRRGVRYVNFGLIGATVDVTRKFDMKLVGRDVRRLDPDLIVYGYGTNEGFQNNLDVTSNVKRAERYMRQLKASAPNADLVYIGAASGLRKKGKRVCGGWSVPRKLPALRRAIKKLAARTGAGYWDWSAAMGGNCAINSWAKKGLAAKDRVHLTSKGYRRSAAAFTKWLTTIQEKPALVAQN